MTTAQVVETSVTVNNNSPIQDYVHPDDKTQTTFEMTPGFKPFTIFNLLDNDWKMHHLFTTAKSQFTLYIDSQNRNSIIATISYNFFFEKYD